MRANERSPVDFAAVKRPHDGKARRLFAPIAGAFHTAISLASSMGTQNDKEGGNHLLPKPF